MPPRKRARTPGPRPAPRPAPPRLPEALRRSLGALLTRRHGEDAEPGAFEGDAVAALLERQLLVASPFAWLEPENPLAPVCWKDALAGPTQACGLLRAHVPALPALASLTVLATPGNLLAALEATVLRRLQRAAGDTAAVVADAKLVGETQEALLQAAAVVDPTPAALEALRGELEALWPEVLPKLATLSHRGQRHVTTAYRQKHDRLLLHFLTQRPDHFVLPAFALHGTPEQLGVAQAVFAHARAHGWSVLSGPGGAGKTYLLGQLAAALKDHRLPNEFARALRCPLCKAPFMQTCSCGFVRPTTTERPVSVALTAPTNRAVAVLRRVVADFGGSIVCCTLHALACAPQTFPVDVLVVDEASMLGAEHGDIVLLVRTLRQACVLLVGDASQLPPVGGGELLRPLLAAAGLPCLQANMRAEAALAAPLLQVREGEAGCMAPHVQTCADEEARHAAVLAAATAARGSHLVLALLNEDRIAYCRYALRRLAPTCDPRDDYLAGRAPPRLFVPFAGLPVRFQNNSLKPVACCGMLGEIVAATEEGGRFAVAVRVSTPDGPQDVPLEGSLARLCALVRPAYAVTVHDSQGGEFDRVDVLLPGSPECPLCSREMLYTAISRARTSATLWSVRTPFEAYVPSLSQPSRERVTPFAQLLRAFARRRDLPPAADR